MTFQRSIASLALAVLGAASPAAAQERLANGTEFESWRVTCEAVGVNETVCVLSQRLVASSGQRFLAELLAFADPEAPGAYLAARVPLGVHFPAGFALRPEASDDQIAFDWQSCSTEVCEALVRLSPEDLETLDAAGTVIAGYLPQVEGEPLVFRVGVAGLRDGVAALARATGAPDPAAAPAPAAE